ncbi:MAG: hypothetical protein AVDCRST_MAG39-1036 [uncultured Sphingomonadaceae bacterium]|uniref:Potassium binding protein Kbp n=1 Tax=uncultured Sphingomonadaceae bacterium TaxID=169976 RepID=A0A6J4SI78_9SPHN|nr:MAG: hypothetical protein AVDCRST_MAG39-1036 [uncultured Sphingomonadaceae bacterium]
MGLFDFFKRDKGKKLFQENAAAEAKAQAIRQEIARLGLPGNITVAVEGSRVKVGGSVPDEATRRKLMVITGNVQGIDSVDDQMQPQQPAPAAQGGAAPTAPSAPPRVHTVESGDSLSKIAKQYYGDPNQYPKIFQANTPMIKDPDEIYPGQVLLIPD